ncbi:MAG: DUF169 domain-containing protein [Desulfonatronovibrionaceae bacterium]
MQSRMASILKLKYSPVALTWADEKPQGAVEFKKGRWGCFMFSFAAAARGRTAVFSRETYGCWGGGVGLGFGNRYQDFPGGEECFHYFLSSGNQHSEKGMAVAENLKGPGMEEFHDDFVQGERYLQGPDKVESFVKNLPITDISAEYVVLKPLDQVSDKDDLKVVTFLANPDQLSALVVLANHNRNTSDNVTIPFAAGCQAIALLPFAEAEKQLPRAVVGLTDISARKNVRKQLEADLLSFAMPLALYQEMEDNVEGSFLFRNTWKAIAG